MKTTVYIVEDEISDLGTKVFFSRTKARNYSRKIVEAFKDELSRNPYMSKKDLAEPIIEDEDDFGRFGFHGSHARIIEGTMDIPGTNPIHYKTPKSFNL